MRPPGAPDQLEQRRRRAVQLLQAGQPMSAVARQMQASVSSVWRWWQTSQRAGPRGLRPTPTPGRPPRLSEGQRRTLERILARGPRRAGYPTGLWTLARVGKVIQRQFGIRYHPSHVWRLLTARGWQRQPLELSETEKRTLRRMLVQGPQRHMVGCAVDSLLQQALIRILLPVQPHFVFHACQDQRQVLHSQDAGNALLHLFQKVSEVFGLPLPVGAGSEGHALHRPDRRSAVRPVFEDMVRLSNVQPVAHILRSYTSQGDFLYTTLVAAKQPCALPAES